MPLLRSATTVEAARPSTIFAIWCASLRDCCQPWSMAPLAAVFGIGCACISHLHQAALLFDGGAGWPVPAFMVGSAGGAFLPPEEKAPLMPGGPTGPGGAALAVAAPPAQWPAPASAPMPLEASLTAVWQRMTAPYA